MQIIHFFRFLIKFFLIKKNSKIFQKDHFWKQTYVTFFEILTLKTVFFSCFFDFLSFFFRFFSVFFLKNVFFVTFFCFFYFFYFHYFLRSQNLSLSDSPFLPVIRVSCKTPMWGTLHSDTFDVKLDTPKSRNSSKNHAKMA